MLQRLRRSLSFRLLAIFLVMGLLFAYGAILGIRWVYVTDDFRELVSGHLKLHIDYVRDDIGSPPSIDNALKITRTVPVDIRIVGPDLEWASDPAFPAPQDLQFGDSDIFSDAADTWLQELDGVDFARHEAHGFLRINQGDYAILVSTPKIAVTREERSLVPIIIGFGLLLVLLAYLAVRWLFEPLQAIRSGAAQIGRGNFEYRVTKVRKDQLGDLADDLNRLAHDVEQMLDAKRQLLFGISHELRSPLSRMKLELALQSEDSAEARGLADDIQEMEKIISTLLEAERLNTRHAAINVSRVNGVELLETLVQNYFAKSRSRLQIECPADLYMNVDEVRVTLLVKNLVANALRYSTPDDGPITISIETAEDAWILAVADGGPGIDEEQVDRIGEPFYRGDPSRNRRTGGSGLGLYLARLVATAHGGELALDTTVAKGARFVVTLPFEPGTA